MSQSADDLPFRVEYAKTGRAGCKGCKMNIAQDSLRIARMVQSHFHDGKQPYWFHQACFFKKQRPTTEGDIAGFENIRYEDQETIRKKIAETPGEPVAAAPGKKGKKRAAQPDDQSTRDYGVEYAKSGAAMCRGCEIKILKGEVRAKKVSFDTEVGMKYGGQPLWHHLDCFAKLRSDLNWFLAGSALPGYPTLKAEDKKKVDALLPAMKSEEVAEIKKQKLDVKTEVKDEVDAAEDAELEKKLIAQNKEFFKYRDNLNSQLSKKEMVSILEKNNQDIPEGSNAILDALSDILTFGALERCPTCKGQFVFNKSNYICNGNINEWVKCENMQKEPPRIPVQLPKAIDLNKYSFLNRKYKVKARALKYVPPSVSTLAVKKEENLEPKIKREKPPLHGLDFYIMGHLKQTRKEVKAAIVKLGGRVVEDIHDKIAAVVANEREIEKMGYKMSEAKKLGIQVIRETFIDELDSSGIIAYIRTQTICDWGTDPATRIPQEESSTSKSKSRYTKSVPKSVTLKLTNGTAVDPDSGLQNESHVLIRGKTKYFAVLSKTDIQKDKNSYYKIQILESDFTKKYWVFRSWGRIGTTIGGTKLELFGSEVSDAIEAFKDLYYDQTGSHFGETDQKKLPGRYYAVETDFGGEELEKKIDTPVVKSKLEPALESLLKLLFDVNAMKKAMLEFDLDMEKMPLGKLSQKQLLEAMKVLQQISNYVRDGATNSEFIGASNQFYTLIPHDFGLERPPVISTVEVVNSKTEMIETLMEMEFAYGLLKAEPTDTSMNSVDGHYKQLNTEMKAIPHDSEEFALLKKYVQNTHAETHSNYELEIQDIFTVERQGEKRRYKPFKKLHNRKLLWHGSRLTNYVGILSHGLKIAPPEAPVTGYMFGKGIYFADMVSKSANYCCTTRQNSVGLMLLCEVALGDMLECKGAKYVTELPVGKHSTKGIGQTWPNPKESHIRADGVEIPMGTSISNRSNQSSLLYNEYIVYDVAQVNVQYLFKMNFNHKFG